jgi:heme A synthase
MNKIINLAPTKTPITAVCSWISAILVLSLLTLGTLITTYRVGMVDPIWPTEPWYLLSQNWSEPSAGYFIEHIHRVVGYISGFAILGMILTSFLANKTITSKVASVICIVGVSLGVFIAMTSIDRSKALADPIGAVNQMKMRIGLGIALASAAFLLFQSINAFRNNQQHAGLQLLALLSYLGVISQGLLGGLRVYLHALVGPELATIHGATGQMVFALVAGTAILATFPGSFPKLEDKEKRLLPFIGWALVVALLFQLAWAVIVRHGGQPWAQRLHMIGAFIVFGIVAWLSLRMAGSTYARSFFKPYTILLGLVVFAQVILGVEAYIGKFATGKPLIQEAVSFEQATVRTLHALTGALLLAIAFAAALRISQVAKYKGLQNES